MKRCLGIGNGTPGTTTTEYLRKHDDQGEMTIFIR